MLAQLRRFVLHLVNWWVEMRCRLVGACIVGAIVLAGSGVAVAPAGAAALPLEAFGITSDGTGLVTLSIAIGAQSRPRVITGNEVDHRG